MFPSHGRSAQSCYEFRGISQGEKAIVMSLNLSLNLTLSPRSPGAEFSDSDLVKLLPFCLHLSSHYSYLIAIIPKPIPYSSTQLNLVFIFVAC